MEDPRIPYTASQNASYAEISAAIDAAQDIAVCAHVKPDGDAIGSTLLLTLALDACGKRVVPLLAEDKPLPPVYRRFVGAERLIPAAHYTGTPDLFVSVDTPTLERLGDAGVLVERAACSLAIDHHPDLSTFATLLFGDATAAACACVVWDIVKAMGVAITPDMAEACYLACITDTGSFRFQNTDASVLGIAAEAVGYGAHPAQIAAAVYQSNTMATLHLQARTIERLTLLRTATYTLAYSWICESDFIELEASEADAEELTDIVRGVQGIDVALLFREHADTVRVSLRAKGDVNVGDVARACGGGGHDAAAGCTLSVPLEDAIAQVLSFFGPLPA